jgi:hypothetical protein
MRKSSWIGLAVLFVAIAASRGARADTTYTYSFDGAGVLAGDNFSFSTDGTAVPGTDYILSTPVPFFYAEQSETSVISVDLTFDSFFDFDVYALFVNCSSPFGCSISPIPFSGLTGLSVPGTYELTTGNAFGSSLSVAAPEPRAGILTLSGIGLLALMLAMRKPQKLYRVGRSRFSAS